MNELENRVMVITGASGGLGGAVVREFAAAGARVAAAALSWNDAPRAERVLRIEEDLLRPFGARAVVDRAISAFGKIDGVVHLMGGFEGGQRVSGISDQTWDRMLDLNLRSAFYMFRAALPHLMNSETGRILAIGSRPALDPVPGLAAYAVSKAGLAALVRTIAAEAHNSPLTANLVAVSVIDTPANRAADPAADHSKWVQPDAIARLLVWLASDAAHAINGAIIPVYGRA